MKHGKRPTRAQKMRLEEVGLNAANWLVVSKARGALGIVHRHTGRVRRIPANAS